LKKFHTLFFIGLTLSILEAAVMVNYTVKSGDTLSIIAQKHRTSTDEISKINNLAGKKLRLNQVLTVAMNTHVPKKKLAVSRVKKILNSPKVKVAAIKRRNLHTLDEKIRLRAKNKALKSNSVVAKVIPSPTESLEARELKQKQVILNLNQSERKRIARARASRKFSLSIIEKKVPHSIESIRPLYAKKEEVKTFKKTQTFTSSKKIETKKTTNHKSYVVRDGDTLFTIARKHHMTVSSLLKINDIKYKETLKLGQKLNILQKTYVAKAKKKTPTKKLKETRKVRKYVKRKKVLPVKLSSNLLSTRSKQVVKKERITVDDIFFKSSQPNILVFSKNENNTKTTNIISTAKTKLGRKYVWGAVGQAGTFDCSGFTSYVYKKNGINIPRTSLNQSKYGKYVSREDLKKGDLIFFDTSKGRKGYVNHVGIYMGDGKFIHASSAKKKVVVSSLSKFYAQRYVGARRPS